MPDSLMLVTVEWFPIYAPSEITISLYKCPGASWWSNFRNRSL